MDDRNYGGTALESRVQFAPETAPFYLYPSFSPVNSRPHVLVRLPRPTPFISIHPDPSPSSPPCLLIESSLVLFRRDIARIFRVWPRTYTWHVSSGKNEASSPPFKFYLDDSLVGSIDVLPTKVSLNQIYTYVLYY